MELGKHFYLVEFCTSQTAVRYGIAMDPPPSVIDNLKLLVACVLDPLREELGRTVTVSSGWRPSQLNSLIGGSSRSQHVTGQAADIVVPGMSVSEVCRAIVGLKLPIDQLIYEFGSWTHVSHSSTRRRGEILTASRNGRRTSYTSGLPPLRRA
jgi:hypothetical protein